MSSYLYNWLDIAATSAALTTPNYDESAAVLLERQNQLLILAGYSTSQTFSFITANSAYIGHLINDLINRWLINDVYLDVGETEVPSTEKVQQFCKKIIDKISKNYLPYCKRLEAQNKYLKDLKDTISSTIEGETRHNDTPNANNDYSADVYTSDITKNSNTTTTDIDAIQRYQDVMSTIDNIYNEWLLEFKEMEMYGEY